MKCRITTYPNLKAKKLINDLEYLKGIIRDNGMVHLYYYVYKELFDKMYFYPIKHIHNGLYEIRGISIKGEWMLFKRKALK